MTPGSAVLIHERYVNPDGPDAGVLARHGLIWIHIHDIDTTRQDDGGTLRAYRSLATNFKHMWFDYEIATTKEHNDG